MDDPRSEIVSTVKALTLAPSPSRQHHAVYRYFAPEAGFLHPMCTVPPGPGSRDEIAGIYEWYRDMSPNISAEVESFVYDDEQHVAYLNVVQTFQIFLSPFKSKPARLLVKITLRKSEDDGKYYIVQQEDYYQPEDILRLCLPFLAPPLVMAKRLTSRICGLNAAAFATARNIVHVGMAFVGMNRRDPNLIDHVHQE